MCHPGHQNPSPFGQTKLIYIKYQIVLQNIDLVKIHDGWYGKTITNPCAKTPLQSKLFKPIYVQLNCLFWSNGYLWPGKNCIAPLHCIGCNCVRVSDNDKKCPLPRKVCQQIKVPLGPQIPTGQSSLWIHHSYLYILNCFDEREKDITLSFDYA